MVLVRAQRALRDLTESGLELVAMWLVTSPWAQQLVSEPSSSHRRVTGAISAANGSQFRILNKSEVLKKWCLSIPPDSSRRDEAPAPNRVKIGRRTSPHAPPEVRRVRSTRAHAPHALQGRRRVKSLISTEKALSKFSQRSGFIHEDYALWKTEDEGHGKKMFQKTIGQIRQCIGHERGTTVAEQTNEFQRATGRGQKKRPEKRSQEGGHRGQEKRRDKKNCPRNKAQDQSSEAATTAMMAVDESDVLLAASADEESDWISDSGIAAYHLCRDREVFSTHVACEGLVRMANDAIVGKEQSDEWTKEATVAQRHGKQAQEYLMDVLEGSTVEQERKEMLWDTCGSLARHEKVQPVQDVHEEAQRRETESMHNDRRDVAETSLFRSRSVAVISPVAHTREERWSHDDLQSDVLCRAPRGAERDGSAMVLVRAQRALRDLTESGLELVAYGMGNEVSTFGDVYSYGILILEIFTGKRPTGNMFNDSVTLHNFAKVALLEQGASLADPTHFQQSENGEAHSGINKTTNQNSIEGQRIEECLISILKVGITCSKELLRDRPAMNEVVVQLHVIKNAFLGGITAL
ncbi:hypothetical protein Acr_00g0096630 [Actinidia rufa]|uniref:Leucine-rich repeat protein kinase family protein n=1 Tax=Actinidia rufa TaxID=165716 RepID=A0A7J0DYX5_9ERIC|nr:hypothetical protein Acr_00g0096630 [Actinidia rufa]